MFKRYSAAASVLIFLIAALSGCQGANYQINQISYQKFEADFTNVFDTASTVVGYARTKDEFDRCSRIIYDRLTDLNRQYDIYNNYPGINNIKTVNDNAGIAPVPVSRDIIGLLSYGKDYCGASGGAVNIALGAVLSIWHDYRTEGINDPDSARLPPMADLKTADAMTDIDDMVIDPQAKTVFLKVKGMSLDVGAIAKGYATKLAAIDAQKAGFVSGVLDIGGNIEAIGKPLDGVRDRWGIGIQDPEKPISGSDNILDTVYVNDNCVVTSGGYQRFYEVDGTEYNHIIDPATLMPATRYSAVTVICKDSGDADMLSTALYILPIDEGKELLKKYDADAVWVMRDNSMTATDGYKAISKKFGGYSAVDK